MRVFNCCWDGKHKNDESCDQYKFNMENERKNNMEENLEILHLKDSIKELQKQIDYLMYKPIPQPKPYKSEQLNELFAALSKAQGEMKVSGMNSENPFFKASYSSLYELVQASRPALSKNGLSVTQNILMDEQSQNILHTILGHSSGQWMSCQMKINPAKPDIQSLGSYISYLRRYCYAAIVGVVSSEDASDDDGEKTMVRDSYKPQPASYERITPEQLEEINYELTNNLDIAETVLKALNIKAFSEIPKSKFLSIISRIRDLKAINKK